MEYVHRLINVYKILLGWQPFHLPKMLAQHPANETDSNISRKISMEAYKKASWSCLCYHEFQSGQQFSPTEKEISHEIITKMHERGIRMDICVKVAALGSNSGGKILCEVIICSINSVSANIFRIRSAMSELIAKLDFFSSDSNQWIFEYIFIFNHLKFH